MEHRGPRGLRLIGSAAQPILHESSRATLPPISNHNTNVNSHSGTGNIINNSSIINNVINTPAPQESDAIVTQAKIAAALKERHVPQAVYSAQLGSGCMDGTRVQVLRDIDAWIKNPDAPQIFWLTGMAGTGKSAIAWTVCARARVDPEMVLGGSFFCSRLAGTSAQRDVRCILPTLVQLLARQSAEFSLVLAAELGDDPDIFHQQVGTQIEHLLYKPLLALRDSPVPIVFVIDALDECGGQLTSNGIMDDADSHSLVSDMLEALVAFSNSPVKLPVKFFVTSRPETHIRDTPVSDAAFSKVLQLHTVNKQLVTADIRLYVSTRLTNSLKLRAQFTAADVDTLVWLCDGLFIVATTALHYALGGGVDRAAMRFKKLLNSTRDGLSAGAAAPLDRMYALILQEAVRVDETEMETEDGLPDLLRILASLLNARMALSVVALADLLELSAMELRARLSHLHAVLHVPDDESEPALRTLHASFGDYLFDRAPNNFRIDPALGNSILAHACFQAMEKRLHFNVSKSSSSFQENGPRQPHSIPLSLEYACLLWVYHVCDLPESETLGFDKDIEAIFLPRLLFWLEVLSVLRRVSRATAMLTIAASTVMDEALSRFLHDALTFVASSREAIEMSAPHIYLSALPFAAKDSLIYRTFFPLYTGLISIQTFGVGPHGGYLVLTLDGHEGAVLSVAYSLDGRLLASGSEDGTVRVWDTRIGEETMAPLRSGDGAVGSVVFAPNGKRLVSGTDAGIVCIWDFPSDQVALRRLSGHSDIINSVALSSDGFILASASEDKTLRLWRVDTGQQLAMYSDHVGGVRSASFSPDGTVLASGSDGFDSVFGSEHRTIQLRDSCTGKPIGQQLQLDMKWVANCCICFSPDSSRIALAHSAEVLFYETQTGKLTASLPHQPKRIQAIQFSPNGQFILTVEHHGDLRLWSLEHDRGKKPSSIIVAGKSEDVNDAAFSPDGSYIATASKNGSIQIWSPGSGGAAVEPLPTHGAVLASVTITPDGATLVSICRDGFFRAWDTLTGNPKHLALWGAHTNDAESLETDSSPPWQYYATWVTQAELGVGVARLRKLSTSHGVVAMAFSSDTRWFALMTSSQLYIWDVATGEALFEEVLYCRYPVKVIFSPDGRFMVTGGDVSIRLRETGTWKKLHELRADTSILSVAFSSKGRQVVTTEIRTVRVWVIRTGQQIRAIENHGHPEAPITISPDGRWVARESVEGALLLVDAEAGVQVAALHAHSHRSPRVAFIPDGRHTVSYSATSPYDPADHNDKKIYVWDVNLARLLSSEVSEDPIAALASATLQNGWLTGSSGELLLWVPEAHRDHLQLPPCMMLIDRCRVVVTVGDGGWHRGNLWTTCWCKSTSEVDPRNTTAPSI